MIKSTSSEVLFELGTRNEEFRESFAFEHCIAIAKAEKSRSMPSCLGGGGTIACDGGRSLKIVFRVNRLN